jgi:PAS domain S-box-containing protein
MSDLSQLTPPQEYFRLALESSRRAIMLTCDNGTIAFANIAAERLFGIPCHQLIASSMESLLPGSLYKKSSQSRPGQARVVSAEFKKQPKDVAISLELDLHFFEVEGAVWMLVFIEDVSERKRAEAALRESEARFREVANLSPVMICCSGADKQATFFNEAWLTFTGRSLDQEIGFGWTAGLHPDDRDRAVASYSSSFEARRHCYLEYRLRRADGEYRWILCSGVPRFAADGSFAGYIASCIDISEEKRAQEQAFARRSLEDVTQLASGVARDFNNVFGAILASSENALTALDDSSPVKEDLQAIRKATVRGVELVRQLEIYGRPERIAAVPQVNGEAGAKDSALPSKEAAPANVTTILVVEDEELLRLAVAKALIKRGFLVIEAPDGNEAIRILADHAADIHVLLLDLSLPGISSRDVFEQAKRICPGIKVVLTSAHQRKTAEATFSGLAVDLFLRKPYTVADLVDRLRSL